MNAWGTDEVVDVISAEGSWSKDGEHWYHWTWTPEGGYKGDLPPGYPASTTT